jgi:hypothetical protein
MPDLPAELPDVVDDAPDLSNTCGCGLHGNEIVLHFPPRRLTKRDALVLAAYLVSMAEEQPGQFEWILRAVQNA